MTDRPLSDDKDWTWVLNDLCPECRFEVRAFPRDEISQMLRTNAAQWLTILEGDRAALRKRPRPDRWSALEYACHVRDVFALYDERLSLMLTEDGPQYANWNQDETAIEKRYGDADPATVRVELADKAERLAQRFETVRGDDWTRTGFRSDGAAFTIESFARYLIHDPEHHLHDVRTGMSELGGAPD